MFNSTPSSLDPNFQSSKMETRFDLNDIAGAIDVDLQSKSSFSFNLQDAVTADGSLRVEDPIASFATSLNQQRQQDSSFWNDRPLFSTSWSLGQSSEKANELVIVDEGVEGWQDLLEDIRNQQRDGRLLNVLTLDRSRDGIRQISEALAGFENLKALHVISHGVEGGLKLGNGILSGQSLLGYAGELTGWRDSLSGQADILLYGCNLAAGLNGQSLVDGIAALTGADVAASSDLTGNAALGGNWSLEYHIGEIDTNVALSSMGQFDWQAILAGTINIDQAWLNSQGSGPYVLKDADTTYVLQTDVNVAGTAFYVAQANITFDLNQHTISYGSANQANKWGVCLYIDWHNTEITIPGTAEPSGFVLRNGNIVNLGTGDRSHGVYGFRGKSSFLHDLKIDTNGKDSHSVYFRWDNTTLQNNILITRTNSTFDRHAGPANVGVGGSVSATGNLLLGGNSGFVVGSDSVISKNIISHTGFATNGYGVWIYRNDNINASDNIIIPSNGRGILANAGNNHVYERNVILHLEAPNEEYGDFLNPPAIRSRYEANNISYVNNTSLGIGGLGLTSASSIYLTNDGSGVNNFSGNDATVILSGVASIKKYAQPLTLEGHGLVAASNDVIDNNVFRSNHLMIRTSGYDGHAKQARPIENNSYSWETGDNAAARFGQALDNKLIEISPVLSSNVFSAASDLIDWTNNRITNLLAGVGPQASRAFWQGKYASFDDPQGSFATILNSTFGPGVDPSTVAYELLNQGKVSLKEGKSSQIQFLNQGVPVVNTGFTVVSDQGDSYAIQTNSSGFAEVPFLNLSLDKADPVGSPFQLITRNISTITFDGFAPASIQHDNVPQFVEIGNKREDYVLQYQGDGLIVYGTEFANSVLWNNSNPMRFTIDGFVFDISNPINWLEFRGLGGVDSIQMVGSSGSDTLLAQVGNYSFTMESGFRVSAKQFENLNTDAGSGPNDLAFLYDLAGDDVFTSFPGSSTLEGVGYRHVASGFDRVTANSSTSTTGDIARFYGSAGNDQLLASPTFTSMTIGTVINRANGFAKTYGFSTAGQDTAYLYDGAGNNQLTGDLISFQMAGNGYWNSASGFYRTFAFGTPGTGYDSLEINAAAASEVILNRQSAILRWGSNALTATGFSEQTVIGTATSTADVRLYGTSGVDSLTASPNQLVMSGVGYTHRASGFQRVRTFAGLGGLDVATFYDSAGDDEYAANSTWARMRGTGYQNEAFGFGQTSGISSTSTIKDTAVLSGTAGQDALVATPDFAQLTGATYSNRAEGFDIAYSLSKGGADTANIHDSAGKDTFFGDLNAARMYGSGYNNWWSGFQMVTAFATTGSDVLVLSDSTGDDLLTLGVRTASFVGGATTITATGFVTQRINSVLGGTDAVSFQVGNGNNLLTMYEAYSLLTGTGYSNRADGFRNVLASATGAGGYNRVALYGSTGIEQMRFEQNYGRCERESWLRRFEGFNLADVYVGPEDEVVVNSPAYILNII